MKTQRHPSIFKRGFTLVEMMIAMLIFAVMMVMLLGALEQVSKAWIAGDRRIKTHQRARGAIELFTREVTPAVVDTRMQFVILPGSELTDAGARQVAPNSQAVLWMAPLGEHGGLRCVGYYLHRDDDKQFYRLKRILIRPDNPDGYFPKLINRRDSRDVSMRTDPVSARWFLNRWDESAFDEEDPNNEKAVVSTATDGVVAFWVQAYDLLGNPVPWLSDSTVHPDSDLIYNSAAYFQVATTRPFEGGKSFLYLADSPTVMKGNRVPAEIEIALVTLDDDSIEQGGNIPEMQILTGESGVFDLQMSVDAFMGELKANGLVRAEVFSTRVKLLNGS